MNNKKSETFRDIFFMYVVIYLCYGILPVSTDNLAFINIDYNQIGMIISINFIVQIISILFFGYYSEKLAKKFGRKKLFFITNIITFVSYGLLSLSQNYYHFIIFIVISAASIGAFLPIGFSIISDMYPPDERGKRYGLMSFGMVLGNGGGILFSLLMGLIIVPHMSWRWTYILACALGLWPTIGYGIKGIDPAHGESEPEFSDYKGIINYDYKITTKTIINLFTKKTVFGILMIVFTVAMATSVLGNWAITYWRDFRIINPVVNSETLAVIIYMVAGLGAIGGNLIGGKLGDNYYKKGKVRGRIYVSFIGSISGIGFLLIFFLAPFPNTTIDQLYGFSVLFMVLGFIGYFLTSFPPPNMFAMVSEVCLMEYRSSANALYGLMVNIAATIGNPLFTFLMTNIGSYFAMTVIFFFWVFSNVFWLLIYIFYPKEAKECRDLIKERRKSLENK
ncbi:MAG: MFS transporter [Candidatus Helarchaeota archaeon]